MRRAGVVCEFNPFHNGHKFLLQKIKSNYADETVCVMSGNFVQRGEIAITDKYVRARAALDNGADMVAELPTVYALSSANIFAENGVRIAVSLGCDCVCFGSENDLETLKSAVSLLENPQINEKINAAMKEGVTYPRALSMSVGKEYAAVLERPNNILALGYIRACRKFNISPIAIPRKGAAHDDVHTYKDIASASRIREMILHGENYSQYTPMAVEKPTKTDALETAILYRLKTIFPNELSQIADVSEGLENRIISAAKLYNNVDGILHDVKTKRYTMSRLRRIVLCAFLNITSKQQNLPVPYCRVLGIKYSAKNILAESQLPLVIKTKTDYDRLNISAKEIFNVDLLASEAMNIASDQMINEFSQGVITT